MDFELSNRAGNYYTNLLEQGVARAAAIEHTRLQFGLTDPDLRHIVAHNFLLENAPEAEVESELSDLLLTYAEAREARSPQFVTGDGSIPYYGD